MSLQFNPIYWSPDRLFSYNKLYNFAIGNRGGGKSFAAKRYCISRFLKTGEQFIYVRRYKNEFDFIKTYFSDIAPYYEGHTFSSRAGVFMIDGKVAGYYLPLSVSTKYKSNSYPLVGTIIYDEFIIDKARIGYLKDEVPLFLDLYETIARTRDVRVLFISNALSSINPYFNYFHIDISSGAKFIKGNETCCEIIYNREYTDMKRKTRFGQLIADTAYGNYAILNNFYLDDEAFIEKASGSITAVLGIKYEDRIFGVYYKESNNLVYITERKLPETVKIYSFFNSDHVPNIRLIESARTDDRMKAIRDMYEYGNVRFESQRARAAFLECMNIL